VLSGEATHTKFIVFGLTRPWFKSTIYRTRSEHRHDDDIAEILLKVALNTKKSINQSIEASTLTITPPMRFQNYLKSYTSKNNKIK
jgi:hypothetical protein